MRIVCTSDVHGKIAGVTFPPGDVLVIAGDVLGDVVNSRGKLARGKEAAEIQLRPLSPDLVGVRPLESTLPMLARFLDEVPFDHVVLVAGNHDWAFQFRRRRAKALLPGKVRYLQDSGTEIGGVKFWGSPWQPEYHGWAFNLPRDGPELAEAWAMIPEGIDVLVTHGPPAGILDMPWGTEPPVGDGTLLERVIAVKPRFHVFGHVHGSYGTRVVGPTTFMNVAASSEANRLANGPQVIVLEDGNR